MRFYQSRQFQMMLNVASLLKGNEKVISSRVPALQEIIPDYVQSMDYLVKLRRGASGEAIIKAGGTPPVINMGGRPKGTPNKVTSTVESMILKMKADKVPVARISRELNLSRQTIYEVLRRA